MSRRRQTYIEFWEAEDGWRATEPEGGRDITGTGPTAPLAVADYCQRVENSPPAEVPADD